MRFSDNPAQNPLVGTEAIPATDVATGDDVKITPIVLRNFVQDTMPLASGSSNGLMSGSNAGKLAELYSNDQIDALVAQLGQIAVPFFSPTLVDGVIEVFENVLENDLVLGHAGFGLSSGSTIMTARIDGIPVTGLTNLAVSSTGDTADATAANTMIPGSKLSLEFSSSGTPENIRLSIRANKTLN